MKRSFNFAFAVLLTLVSFNITANATADNPGYEVLRNALFIEHSVNNIEEALAAEAEADAFAAQIAAEQNTHVFMSKDGKQVTSVNETELKAEVLEEMIDNSSFLMEANGATYYILNSVLKQTTEVIIRREFF